MQQVAASSDSLAPIPSALRSARVSLPVASELGSRAFGFLCHCGRLSLSPEAAAQLAAVGATLSEEDWVEVLDLAGAHRMSSLVFYHVARLGLLNAMPGSVGEGLRQAYCQTWLQNRRMQSVLGKVLDRLASEGIPTMALKGLALAGRYYGNIALRPMVDIDLLVPRAEVSRVCRILRQFGYAPSSGSGRPSGFNAQTHAVLDYLRAGSPQIEVHWELFNHAVYRSGLPAETAWQRAEEIELCGQPVRYLAPADELRYLSVHYAAEHHLARLIWGVDIAELVRGLPASWDWDGFVRETIAAHQATPVAKALTECQARFALALPPGMLDALGQAAGSAAERDGWAASQSEAFSAPWIRAHAAVLRGPLEWSIFLRGLLLPRAPALAERYGAMSTRWHKRAQTHVRHLRWMVPELLASVLRSAAHAGLSLNHARSRGPSQ